MVSDARDNRVMPAREHGRRTHNEPVADTPSDSSEAVAERLDQLTLGEVERIIERAIEMQSVSDNPSQDVVDRDMLRRIADELDIDPVHLEKALREEVVRTRDDDGGWFSRNVVPTHVSERIVAPGDPAAVAAFVDEWMTRHEGLRKRRSEGGSVRWEKDDSLVASARMGLKMSQGSGKLRGIDGVTTSLRPLEPDQQVVALDGDLTNHRRIAVALLAGAVGLGALTAGATTAVTQDPMSGAVAGTLTTAFVGGGILLGFRMWADSIRRALQRTADAIANPALVREAESVPGAIHRLFDEWRSKRASRGPR